MRVDPRDESARWLQQANQDIDDARYNKDGARYHLTCFLAQQAAEKALQQAQGIIRQVTEALENAAQQTDEIQ